MPWEGSAVMICPHCDGDLDAYVPMPWGDGQPAGNIVPFICSWCASLMFLQQSDVTLFTIPEIEEVTGINVAEVIGRNPLLSEKIDKSRLAILKLRNRRPVLR